MKFAWNHRAKVIAVAAMAWLLGLVATVLLKPPQGALSSDATGPEALLAVQSIVLLTIAVALGTVAMVRWAEKQQWPAWMIAAALAAAVAVWTVMWFPGPEDWRCQQPSGVWKIVGDQPGLLDDAKQNMATLGVKPCEYLWKDEGNVEDIWAQDSVAPRRTTVRRWYLAIAPLVGFLILAAGQVSFITRVRAPEEAISPELAAARARLRIFINYRKDDTEDAVDSLYKYLIRYFDPKKIFRDKEGIPGGAEYEKDIMAAVGSSDVFLAVIGPAWLTIKDKEGQRRLDNPSDLLRREIERALETNSVTVMPLLHKTPMPAAADLPTTMTEFAKRQARQLRSEPDLKHDQEQLLVELDRIAQEKASAA
jgi:hypothetical protein